MTMLIVAAGVFNLAFAVFHLFFWRLFRWDEELPRLGAVNRGIMQVLNLSLTYCFAVSALLLLSFPIAVASTDIGRFLLLAMTGFWLMRAVFQPMFFGLKAPLSLGLFVVLIVGVLLHGAAWWSVRMG